MNDENDENESKTSPTSPCVRNCCLDENDICMGCGRHINEILAWHQASGNEREDMLAQAKQRLIQRAERNKS